MGLLYGSYDEWAYCMVVKMSGPIVLAVKMSGPIVWAVMMSGPIVWQL